MTEEVLQRLRWVPPVPCEAGVLASEQATLPAASNNNFHGLTSSSGDIEQAEPLAISSSSAPLTTARLHRARSNRAPSEEVGLLQPRSLSGSSLSYCNACILPDAEQQHQQEHSRPVPLITCRKPSRIGVNQVAPLHDGSGDSPYSHREPVGACAQMIELTGKPLFPGAAMPDSPSDQYRRHSTWGQFGSSGAVGVPPLRLGKVAEVSSASTACSSSAAIHDSSGGIGNSSAGQAASSLGQLGLPFGSEQGVHAGLAVAHLDDAAAVSSIGDTVEVDQQTGTPSNQPMAPSVAAPASDGGGGSQLWFELSANGDYAEAVPIRRPLPDSVHWDVHPVQETLQALEADYKLRQQGRRLHTRRSRTFSGGSQDDQFGPAILLNPDYTQSLALPAE